MTAEKKYIMATSCIFAVAVVDGVGALLGFWSVSGGERTVDFAAKGLVLLGLVLLSLSITRWVYRNTPNPKYRKIAWLSFVSLVVCIGGDVVNANLPNTFYRYEGVVKHDYLADSVWFFGPGYSLLLVNGVFVAIHNQVKGMMMYGSILIGCVLGVMSVFFMHLPDTGLFVTTMTGGYAALIGAVAVFGVVLVYSFGGRRASYGAWLVGLGFLLAGVADAVIGQFWIYGNGGEGYYPAVRHVNWVLYIGSQCLVIYLPAVLVRNNVGCLKQ